MLDKSQGSKYIFNVPLAVYTGQYHLLDPNGPKIFGYNTAQVTCIAVAVLVITITMVTTPLGIYNWINDTNQLCMELAILTNFTSASYKIIFVIWNANDIWKFLDVTRLDFAGLDAAAVESLRKCRTKSMKITYLYTGISLVSVPLWTVAQSTLFEDSVLRIKGRDNAYREYRLNVVNMYMPVSAEIINNEYYVFFKLLENFLCVAFLYFMFVFDTILVSTCMALCSQLEAIGRAFSSIGHKTPDDELNKNDELNITPVNNYEDLINTIIIHQRVFKRMQEFHNIFGQVILTHIAVASCTVVFLLLIISMNFYKGEMTDLVHSLKMFSGFTIYVFQLFTTCYLYGNLKIQNDSTNFSIYSCNWTVMDLECQKLILLSMKMNNAYQLEMKITNTKVVNLHLFVSVMRTCYSIVSVIVNSTVEHQ